MIPTANVDEFNPDEVNMVSVYRSVLEIVAHLQETQYSEVTSTELSEQQADVVVHNDLPDPASEFSTSQG
jgi:hypothetical protein